MLAAPNAISVTLSPVDPRGRVERLIAVRTPDELFLRRGLLARRAEPRGEGFVPVLPPLIPTGQLGERPVGPEHQPTRTEDFQRMVDDGFQPIKVSSTPLVLGDET